MDPISHLSSILFSLILKTERPVLEPIVEDTALDVFVAAWTIDHPIAFEGFDEGDRRLMTASLGAVAGYREGRLQASPRGDNDKGSACGVMQTHAENLTFGTCKEARASRRRGFEEGLAYMVRMIEDCNPGRTSFTLAEVLRGLGGYATGRCGGYLSGSLKWCRKAHICE